MLHYFNQLMDYIEEHLSEQILLEDAAKKLGISDYHLKRTFSFLSGMTLPEYIKKRRLACANQELVNGATVTDVAFKYGYQTLDGFSRAFRDWTGYLPSEAVKEKRQKTFPKLSFYIDVRGGNSMEFKIEKKEKFKVVGVSKRVPLQFEGKNQHIMELAQSITEKQREQMHDLADLYPREVLNVSYDFEGERMQENGTLKHMIGFATTKENPYDDLVQLDIEQHTWAIFPNQGPFPQTLQDTWARIFSEWLPASSYELAEVPEISFTKWSEGPENAYSEIWIAVKEKN
ncbi:MULTISPECIES: AraC family transcriptional regulator [unclassified Enterococcus]|jgi:AraC family transcriptional regulator|uniref:AraC family transcriptional regulator n=1 Tax=unclassified Enterococcus TaxID=2608891 RepID=UPI003D2CB524